MTAFTRIAAASTLMLLLAMTTANYWCALCHLQSAKAEASSHCHEGDASTGVRVAAGHDCSEHETPEVIASARTEPTIVLIAGSDRIGEALVTPLQHASSRRAPCAAPTPPDLYSIPLRI